MGMKKRTKPSVPGKTETAKRLWAIRWLKNSPIWGQGNLPPYKFATLWDAASEFIKTDMFKDIVHEVYKNKPQSYLDNFWNYKDTYGNLKDTKGHRIGTKRQIKFVLNMFRDKEYSSKAPKQLIPKLNLSAAEKADQKLYFKLFQGLGSLAVHGRKKKSKKN